jgi:hypothetical protein
MALHRAIFEVTCDASGVGSDDVTLALPSNLSRHSLLTSVTVDVSAAVRKPLPSVTISGLIDVEDEDWNDTVETVALGEQVYHVDMVLDTTTYPSAAGVYEFLLGTAAGRATIRRKQARCEVQGGAGDVYTVCMYYETAGDWRF